MLYKRYTSGSSSLTPSGKKLLEDTENKITTLLNATEQENGPIDLRDFESIVSLATGGVIMTEIIARRINKTKIST